MGFDFDGANHNAQHPRWPGAPATVELDDDDPRHLSVGPASAARLFELLGVPLTPVGELPIPEARERAARGRASVPTADLTRTTVGANGALPSLGQLVARFETLLDVLAALGATHVRWS